MPLTASLCAKPCLPGAAPKCGRLCLTKPPVRSCERPPGSSLRSEGSRPVPGCPHSPAEGAPFSGNCCVPGLASHTGRGDRGGGWVVTSHCPVWPGCRVPGSVVPLDYVCPARGALSLGESSTAALSQGALALGQPAGERDGQGEDETAQEAQGGSEGSCWPPPSQILREKTSALAGPSLTSVVREELQGPDAGDAPFASPDLFSILPCPAVPPGRGADLWG